MSSTTSFKYDSKSRNANEFINDEEILKTISQVERGDYNIRDILNKANEMKGLEPNEALALLLCDDKKIENEMFEIAKKIKLEIYGKRIVLFAPLYLSNYCINGCVYCPYHAKNKHIARKQLTQDEIKAEVIALQDMGHLKGRVGTAILGAAIIDDILGIVLLSIMTSLGGASGFHIQAILKILIQMAAFFAISIIGGVGIKKFFEWLSTYKNPEIERHRRRVPVFALAFCLALAFLAEVFGIADITGAYLAGIILCRLPERFYIYNKIEILSYMLITPVFFASIGLNVNIHGMTQTLIIFTIILCVIAVISKIAGCGFGALLCKYTKRESVQIGAGMVCRGEVALIVAQKGISVGLLSEVFFAPVVIMVLVTTLLSPIILKMLFAK